MTARLETELTRRLGLEAPIIQAPIGGLASPELASAVANAGGLGMLAQTWSEPDELRAAIRETRDLTDRPFGVNLILEWPQDERVAICLEEGVRIVSFFWGDPGPHLDAIHRAGAIALMTIGSAAEARRVVDQGVDIVVAQGWEAGGHVWGEVATLPLVPAVVDAVAPVPVVAAGGIADGRGLAAVLSLGAAGAWLGTRFVLAAETRAHPRYRELMLAADETTPVHSSLFDLSWPNAPHRTLRNSTFRAWELAGRPPSGTRPGEGEVIATAGDGSPINRYASSSPRADVRGDIEAMSLWAGQSVGLVREIRPAADIVRQLVEEAVAVLRALDDSGPAAASPRTPVRVATPD
jgi:nitronate monooxygenase